MPVRLETKTMSGSISDALSSGFSELQSLRDEMGEWRDNMQEKLSQTEKYQRVSDCADALDEIADCEDECVPPIHADDEVKWAESKKKSKKSPYPRWLRVSNAVSALDAAKSEMAELVEDEENDIEEDDRLSIQVCIDKLDEVIDGANSLEFPGMYG